MRKVDVNDVLDKMVSEAARRGLIHHQAEDRMLDGRSVTVGGQALVNFASCSYLGLELDPRVIEGTIDAARRYGSQFSSSRAYLSAPPYEELEATLQTIFGGFPLVTPSTTLGHIAALPVLVGPRDVVVVDQLAHHSLRTALELVRAKGVVVELSKHNRMDELEARIERLERGHERVWYVADGVYSMFGDRADFQALARLQARFPNLHLYLDDAHGMSWTGLNGRGTVLESPLRRERLVLATSLNKAFAAGGGLLVFPDRETWRRVRTCGGPMIFSGPVQPPMLGAALASARIHASGEVAALQAALRERIDLCDALLRSHGLASGESWGTPIQYVKTGLPHASYALGEQLLAEGFFVNVATFPAVPMREAGIRFTLTTHQTASDIRALVDALARHAPGRTPFKPGGELSITVARAKPALSARVETSIQAIAPALWNELLGGRGAFDWEALRLLEATFAAGATPTDRWDFRYLLVTDETERPVLATFFTSALWKDDMLADARVSAHLEGLRHADPQLLTSQVVALGSLLTEGNHLYLDRTRDWQGALRLLFDALQAEQERVGANMVVLRDLSADDAELDAFLLEGGFVKAEVPAAWSLDAGWKDEQAFLAGLSRNARRHQLKAVLPHNQAYEVRVAGPEADIAHLYGLYENVRARSLELNTFPLPVRLFEAIAADPHWELVTLSPPGQVPVGFIASYLGTDTYCPMVVGLDYAWVAEAGLYRQCLRQAVERARTLGRQHVALGLGAPLEKARFGATPSQASMYVQLKDHYAREVLAQLEAQLGV